MDDHKLVTKSNSENKVEGHAAQLGSGEQAQTPMSGNDILKELSFDDAHTFRSVVKNLPEVFFTLTLEGKLSYLNPAFQTITGWSCEDWIGRPFIELIHPDDITFAQKSLMRFINGEDLPPTEITFLNKDGDSLIGEVSAVFHEKDGKIINIVGMVDDITAQKRAQDDLLKSKNRLELIAKIASQINSSATLDSIINNTVHKISEFFGDFRIVYSTIDNNGLMRCKISRQPENMVDIEGIEFDLGSAPEYLNALKAKQVIISEDITKDDRFKEFKDQLLSGNVKALVDAPVFDSQGLAGMLCINSPEPCKWTEYEVETLKEASENLGLAIKNSRQAYALRQSEERYRALFDQSPVGVYIFDKDLKITNCNKRMEEILGVTQDRIVGFDISNFGNTRIYSLIENVLNGQPAVYEGLCEFTRGAVKPYVCVRLSPLMDEKQNVVGGMAVVEDITENKKAEEMLAVQEQRIRSLYEISAEPGFGIDQQITETLKTGCDLLGLEFGIIGHNTGKDFTVLYSFDQLEAFEPGLKVELDKTYCSITLAAKDVITFDNVGLTEYKDHPCYKGFKLESYIAVPIRVKGEEFGTLSFSSFQPRVIPFNKADKEFIRLMGRWVSTMIERKQTEVMLGDKEELYRTLVENAHNLIVESKIDGTLVYLNSNHKDILGYDVSDLLGKSVFECIHEDDCSPVTSEFMRALMTNSAANAVFRFKHKNGGWRWLESSGKSFKTSNGELRWVIDSRDITERKSAEEQIKRSLVEKESLLREIHHRVKNNLQVISSLLSLQSDYAKGIDSSRLFDESQNRISAIALIHEQLYQSEDLAEINIGGYINNLTHNLLTVYGDEGNNVSVEFDTDDLRVDIDTAIPCGLIINELFSNCLKHAFKCRGNSTKQKTNIIKVGFNSDSRGQYIMSVADNGCGLPPGLDFKETETLGLQLVCTLADQLSGDIEFVGDKGSRFNIRFPNQVSAQ